MGNGGLQSACRCQCLGDKFNNPTMQIPLYPTGPFDAHHLADGGTGGAFGNTTLAQFNCADLNSEWCCPNSDQGHMVYNMPHPVLDPVHPSYPMMDKASWDMDSSIPMELPDPYAKEDSAPLPGFATVQRDHSDPNTQLPPGRTASDWANDQAQFSHLPPLPPGWLRVISRSTAKMYYCFPETGETTFVEPTGPPASTQAKPKLPPGWAELISRSTGRVYFWNAELQKSQFDIPTGNERPELLQAQANSETQPPIGYEDPSLPPGWVTMVSRSTGRTYYFNSHTQQSQFDRPT